MSSGNVRVVKWGTILTWAIGSKAATFIVPVIAALAIFIGIMFSTVGSLSGWLQQGVNAGQCAVSAQPGAQVGPPTNGKVC